jgi:antigen flippase
VSERMSDAGGATAARRSSASLALAKATVVIGGFSVVNLAAGLIRGKYAAEVLGTAGVGVLSQANNFFGFGTLVCALGFAAGVIRRTAEARAAGRPDEGLTAASTAFTAQMLVTAVFVLSAVALLHPLYGALFSTRGFEAPFRLVLLGLPFTVVASGVLDPVFFGANRYDLYTKASVAAVVLGLAPFLVMTALWGTAGAIAAIPVAAVLRFLAFLRYGAALHSPARLFRPRIDVGALAHLFRYGAVMFAVAAVGGAVSLLIRSWIIHGLGEHENGLYQVPVAFSGYYAPFLTNGLWGYFYPFVSGHPEGEGREELRRALRMIVLAVTGVAFGLLLVQELAISLVFSREFLAATEFLPLQVLGDLFYFPAFTIGVFLLGRMRLRAYVAAAAAFPLLQGAFTLLLLPVLGLRGVAASYTLAAAGFLAIGAGLCRQSGPAEFRVPGIRALLATSAVLLSMEVGVAVLGWPWWCRVVPLGIWLVVALSRPEVAELVGWSTRHGIRMTSKLRQRLGSM